MDRLYKVVQKDGGRHPPDGDSHRTSQDTLNVTFIGNQEGEENWHGVMVSGLIGKIIRRPFLSPRYNVIRSLLIKHPVTY